MLARLRVNMPAAFTGRRVLGLFPHPDDEAYAAAGLLALCADGGADVQLLCATRGERGQDRGGAAGPGAALGARRTAELEASCRALGVTPPVCLDLPDGGLADTDGPTAVALVAAHLHRANPHVVVTLGHDGVYGSRDHITWTGVVARAVAQVGGERRFLHAVFPRDLFAPVRRGLYRSGTSALDPSAPRRLGVDPADVDLRLDIRPLRQRKLAAIAAHRSQLIGGDPLTFLRPGLIAPLLDEEWYLVASGPALPRGAADPFAGL